MDTWVWWLIAAGVLGILEAVTPFLVFGMLAVAALVGMLLALIGVPIGFQILGFAAAALATLVIVRPLARKYGKLGPGQRMGTSKVVGQDAVVLERVDKLGGRVKVAGEVWSARAYDPTLVLEAGSTVQVIEIDGATALVYGHGSEIEQ